MTPAPRIPSRPRCARTHAALLLLAVFFVLAAHPARAQGFTELNAGLAAPPFPCAAWADYDGDGDLDVLIAGMGKHDVPFTTLYRNDAGVFTDSGILLPGLSRASAAWGDFDGDGDVDLAMTGLLVTGLTATRLLRNDGATFTNVTGPFQSVFAGSIAWGDCDGDGDLDLLVTGVTSPVAGVGVASTRLYRNDGGGAFVSIAHPFPACYVGAAGWADFDRDGRLDLVLTGSGETGALFADLWHNDGGGVFSNAGAGLPATDIGPAIWGDVDADGDLDLLLGGNSVAGYITRLYRNDGGGVFTDASAGLLGLLWASAGWCDFDGDGDLDLLTCGYDPVATVARTILWRQGPGGFVDSGIALHNIQLGTTSWADVDGDGDADLLLGGNETGIDLMVLDRNDAAAANAAPSTPSALVAQATADGVRFAWGAASDDHTPAAALSYNLRVGTSPGASDVVSPMALADGKRRVPALGNASSDLALTVSGLTPGATWWWSVQAIDQEFRGGAFAAEQSFTYPVTAVGDLPRSKDGGLDASPNPFRASTTLRLAGAAGATAIAIFDPSGRVVRRLGAGASQQAFRWDGRDDAGRVVPAGLYLVRAEDGARRLLARIVRLN